MFFVLCSNVAVIESQTHASATNPTVTPARYAIQKLPDIHAFHVAKIATLTRHVMVLGFMIGLLASVAQTRWLFQTGRSESSTRFSPTRID